MRQYFRYILVAILAAATIQTAVFGQGVSRRTPRDDLLSTSEKQQLKGRIAKLIEQLGADSYATRQNAQAELERIGLLAFDQLREASLGSDPQIASIAQYLLQSTRQVWVWDSDPYEVTQILEGYGTSSQLDRESRISRLLEVPETKSLTALCRIARYETKGSLSRVATIGILRRRSDGDSEEQKRIRIQTIRQVIGDSNRETSQWLRRFADYLETNEFDADWWVEQAEQERELLAKLDAGLSRPTVSEFHRWLCQELILNNANDTAVKIANHMISLSNRSESTLLDLCKWATKIGLTEVVAELANGHREEFERNPHLGYVEAEMYLKKGDEAKADQIAAKILDRTPFSSIPSPHERKSIADSLRDRGLFKWASSEYERGIALGKHTERIWIDTITVYAEMLHDGSEDAKAASVLASVVKGLETQPMYREQIDRQGASIGFESVSAHLMGRYYYFLGRAAEADLDQDRARTCYLDSIDRNPNDSDTLIAAYQCEGDREWKAQIEDHIDTLTKELLARILTWERRWRESDSGSFATDSISLAMACNEYAWLISQTTGDLDAALKRSQTACEIASEQGAFVDTLAAVYFKRGDVDLAIETQRRAVALEPNSRGIKATLLRYEAAK